MWIKKRAKEESVFHRTVQPDGRTLQCNLKEAGISGFTPDVKKYFCGR